MDGGWRIRILHPLFTPPIQRVEKNTAGILARMEGFYNLKEIYHQLVYDENPAGRDKCKPKKITPARGMKVPTKKQIINT